ncbi:MAG: tetratricopeptide repeat protein [Terrimicrobiaceae bacterium]|nr:tetratricopeptide repeat protein [Terrimicrobiaceae bacterium]
MKFLTAAALLAMAIASARSQGLWEPEVRRGEPANPRREDPPANPEWMSRVAPSPSPSPQTTALSEPAQTPPPPTAPGPDSAAPETFRLRPREGPVDEAREQLDKANSIYARKMHEFAAMEYEKFLELFPGAPGRDAAWFRLGECRRILGNKEAARAAFERLAAEFQEGEFLGAGAYRLGEALFAEAKYEEALRRFQQAASLASSSEVRLAARYQSGRCLERLGRLKEAAEAFAEVAAAEGQNPYRDHARLAHADALQAAGSLAEALAVYEQVAREASHPALKAEGAVKAGSAAAAAGDPSRARAFFDRVLAEDEKNPWRSAAHLGKLRLAAAEKRPEEVLKLPAAVLEKFQGETRAEALALTADAHRALGRPAKAAEFYKRLLDEFPGSRFAASARFARVVALHEAGDASATREARAYLETAPEGDERTRVVLLLAERFFAEGNYGEAAARYAEALEGPGLTETMRRQAAYKRAWCLAKLGEDQAAEEALTAFLSAHPGDELAPAAMLQRGICRQKTGRLDQAIEDFQAVIEQFPDARERQQAMLQKALTLGQLDRKAEMKEAFLGLLKAFPKGEGAAQAEYWIGWAAFEEKDYEAAAPRFARARELDAANFGERAGLRLALCYYYLARRQELLAEIARLPNGVVPREAIRWAGLRSAQEGDFQAAERLLASLESPDPEALVTLAESRIALGKNQEALEAAQAAVANLSEPAPRARALLAAAEAQRGLKNFDQAEELAEEALRLQPEGRLNAAGRMALAEIAYARGQFEPAARAFMSVALLYDEPLITPRALERAADSYRRANDDAEADRATEELRRRFPDYAPAPAASSARQSS